MERAIINKLNEGRVDEDWRDGTFSKEDIKKYCTKMEEDAGRILFSLNNMIKQHPEHQKELMALKMKLKNRFQQGY